MVNFKDLYFSDNGMISYCIHNNRKIFNNSSLWKIICSDSTYTIESMNSFTYTKSNNYIDLKWESSELIVTVTILYTDKYEFNISVKSNSKNIDRIMFPVLDNVNSLGADEESYMLLPRQCGWVIKNPLETICGYKKEFPFWLGRGKGYYEAEYPCSCSFQFLSYYCENTFGCYFATEDSEAYIKTFGLYDDGKSGLSFAVINYPENMGVTSEYVQPYNFVLDFFKGDWQESADMYRKWAIQQKWVGKRLTDREINEHIFKTDFWRINHENYRLGTRTDEYLKTCIMLRDILGAEIGLHWYGWNMGEHDVNYPEYISRERVAEGWNAKLKNWVRKFHEEGFCVVPYVNGRLWDVTSKSWYECSAEIDAIKDREQQLLYEPWKGDALKPMCPSSVLWNEKVSGFSEYVNEFNFDGLYVDQVAAFNATLCFDKKHPHPHGGGTWWKNAYTQMIRMLRKKSCGSKIFTSESCCEAYMDVFDMFLVLTTMVAPYFSFKCLNNYNADPVPLFNMVYGDYSQLYGSTARFSDQINVFEFNFIRNILWGFMPTVEGGDMEQLTDEKALPYISIIKNGVDFYKENKALLTFGRIKRVLCEECNELVFDFGEVKLKYPSVISVLWEDTDGELFKLVYNADDSEQILSDGEKVKAHSFLKETCE